MTRFKCNHKLTVFSSQPSNIINSNTKRMMPGQPSHRTNCRKVSNILPLRHILLLDNKQGVVEYGYFPATPQTVEVK